ncbi:HD domain-containing protein [Streptacidiphilus anmyonensis]|uniref:HD domain-containing protein n=1 Tax=Streptacidiphilus anmyonensis TaxID=405782 RepID=UPI000A874924|nr:HD domain-containing protein [Streptacidiphilus anmyonensis]
MPSTAAQPNRTLRHLAVTGALPDRQRMDRETLDWIEGMRPSFLATAPRWARHATPLVLATGWFADPDQADGIHGVRHGARVATFAGLLARQASLPWDTAGALRLAAAVHDCRRLDDRTDPGHGRRAAHWLTEHATEVTAQLAIETTPQRLGEAAAAVALHDVPYCRFTPAQEADYARARQLTDLLKAADCLDRYRLPRADWWPDTSRLRIEVPAWLSRFAFDAVVRSERARLNGATNHASVNRKR